VGNQLGSTSSLSKQLAEKLKARLREGEWAPSERLPSENEIAEEFGVSRVTVRTSLKLLESAGFVETRQGAGTFVTPFGNEVRTSLHELRSLTDTIRDLGHTPSMKFRFRGFDALPDEAALRLQREPGSGALHLQREVASDGTVVAVSFDWIPVDLLPQDVTPEAVVGSTFAFLESLGLSPVQSTAEIHAAEAREIDWGSEGPAPGVCVLLKQTHYAQRGRPVMFSRTYFIEGRFQFVIRRTR
jgi:GntR family transcriptional regulator